MSQWVRLWEDMPTDPKWRIIAKRSGRPACEVIALFTMMMTNAGSADPRGSLSSWDDEAAAITLDMEVENVAAIREAMQGKVLDGDALLGWEKRQPKREDNSAERVKAFRERHSEAKRDVTPRNDPVTPRNAPEEKREDTEADKKDTPPPSLESPASAEPRKLEGGGGIDEIDCLERVIKSFPGVKRFGQEQALALIGKLSGPDRLALASGSEAYAAEYRDKPTTHPRNFRAFVAERLFANYAPRPVSCPVVTVLQDSPEGRALEAEWRATKGKPPPWTNGRWYVPAASATASEGLRQ